MITVIFSLCLNIWLWFELDFWQEIYMLWTQQSGWAQQPTAESHMLALRFSIEIFLMIISLNDYFHRLVVLSWTKCEPFCSCVCLSSLDTHVSWNSHRVTGLLHLYHVDSCFSFWSPAGRASGFVLLETMDKYSSLSTTFWLVPHWNECCLLTFKDRFPDHVWTVFS